MEKYIQRPDITQYPGVKVDKDTNIEYKNEFVEQTIKDLKLHSITKVLGEGYESTYDTIITLEEGDILLFEDEKRGYIKPVESFVKPSEAIEDLQALEE